MDHHSPLPPELYEKVMRRINGERRAAGRRRALRLFGLVASALLSAAAVYDFGAAASSSGFLAYASLLFTDSGIVLAQGADYGLAMLESFPASHAIAVIALLWVSLWSLGAYARAASARAALVA